MASFDLQRFFIVLPVLLLSIAIHEFAHCWVTDRLGDDTPRRLGRVTLNPLKHLDPMGTLMIIVSSFAGFGIGWGKASPFNPANFKNPARDRMLSTIAGPISNLVQMLAWASLGVLLTSVLSPMTPVYEIARSVCYFGLVINAVLAAFNLIPIYPLDGHHILSYLAPPSWRPVIDNPLWGIVFIVLVFSGKASLIIGPLVNIALIGTRIIVGPF